MSNTTHWAAIAQTKKIKRTKRNKQMNKATTIMLRAIAAFIVASWFFIGTIILAYIEMGGIALVTGSIAAILALVSWLDYHHAEELAEDYDDDY